MSFQRDFWWPIVKPCPPIFWPPNKNQDRYRWAKRHMAAAARPELTERGVVALISGWVKYAESNGIGANRRMLTSIGKNSKTPVLTKVWAQVGRQILLLIRGDIGRLDSATLDFNVKAFARERGVEL